jgi:hypothetical protein
MKSKVLKLFGLAAGGRPGQGMVILQLTDQTSRQGTT